MLSELARVVVLDDLDAWERGEPSVFRALIQERATIAPELAGLPASLLADRVRVACAEVFEQPGPAAYATEEAPTEPAIPKPSQGCAITPAVVDWLERRVCGSCGHEHCAPSRAIIMCACGAEC